MSDRALARGACALLVAVGAVAADEARAATVAQRVHGVTFEAERSPDAQAALATCAQTVRLLVQRGWEVEPVTVRIQSNPFDATSPAADIVLDANQGREDGSFALAEALVERQLRRIAGPRTARFLAQEVAAHLSPPGSASRLRWESAWQGRLAAGDVLTSALPELLWRSGGDAAIRRAGHGEWPASGLEALTALGVENPTHTLGEVAIAGLMDPAALGFHTPPVPGLAAAVTQPDAELRLERPGLRVVQLADDAGAVGVVPLESTGAEGWVAVRYALTGTYDVLPLNLRAEITVPLRGAAWAGVIAVAVVPDAHLSLGIRSVPDYPVVVRRWDFLASDRSVSLSWETQHQEGLRAFVVEALEAVGDGSWTVARRTVLPVADGADTPYGYAFVDDEAGDVAAYRLLALTADGFLAELGSFPLRDTP